MCSERNKIEAKVITQHISCDCKSKFNSTTCNSNQTWNNKTCQCESKNYCKFKNSYSWNPSAFIGDNSKYLKSIVDTSVIECDEIIFVMDILSTKMTNTIATNESINYSRKVKYKFDCYILHSFISDHITINNNYYLLSLCKA